MKITKRKLKRIIREEMNRVLNESDFDSYWEHVDKQYDLSIQGAEKEDYRHMYETGWRFLSDRRNHAWVSPEELPWEYEDPYTPPVEYDDPDEPYGGDVEARIAANRRKQFGR